MNYRTWRDKVATLHVRATTASIKHTSHNHSTCSALRWRLCLQRETSRLCIYFRKAKRGALARLRLRRPHEKEAERSDALRMQPTVLDPEEADKASNNHPKRRRSSLLQALTSNMSAKPTPASQKRRRSSLLALAKMRDQQRQAGGGSRQAKTYGGHKPGMPLDAKREGRIDALNRQAVTATAAKTPAPAPSGVQPKMTTQQDAVQISLALHTSKPLPPSSVPFDEPRHMTVHITSLHMKTTTIRNLDPTLTILALKQRYASYEKNADGSVRYAPENQWLWFPVPKGTPGAQHAQLFKWWDKRRTQSRTAQGGLPEELFVAMSKSPLKLASDDETIKSMALLQRSHDEARCFFIANVAGRRRSSIERIDTLKRIGRSPSKQSSGSCCTVQ